MAPAKRVLSKEEPQERNIPAKRSKTVRRDKGGDLVPNLKLEDMTKLSYVGAGLKNRGALSPKDLPPDCLRGYRVLFRPAIKDLAGTLSPWDSPTDADITRIWNTYFPKHRLELSSGLHNAVSKLVEDTIRHWRRDMAVTAVKYVNMTLKSSYDKQSQRVTHAAFLLGRDAKDRKRPFYYRNYHNGVQPSGIFQSPYIAATLATHVSSISCLPEESRLQEYPTGALALSILAVKRALTWAETGLYSIPKTPEGYFSRANWGDHYKLRDGRYVLVKAASNIVSVIDKLRDIQWERILTEAEKYSVQRNGPSNLKPLQAEEDQSDFEIEDWDDEFE